MGRPTTRVLAVLELLQAHRSMSGAELARRLEVDRRTVRRYIAALEDLGIPITAERGSAGGYMLVAGFKLPPLMFTDAGVLECTADGVLLRGEVDDLDWFARQLARLSFPFEILRPAALRSALQAHAARLQRLARGAAGEERHAALG